MALPHDLAEQNDVVIDASVPERVNFVEALCEVLDAYVRCRLMSRSADHSLVFVSQTVYELAERNGLLDLMGKRHPKVEFRVKPSTSVRGCHADRVIFDEVAEFDR